MFKHICNNVYKACILKEDGLTNFNEWFDRIAYIIDNIKTAYQEHLAFCGYSGSTIAGPVASILNILARSIEKRYVEQANEKDNRFGEILRFINTNIFNNDKLRMPYLADKFGISKSYFSECLKKQADMNLADYIINTKRVIGVPHDRQLLFTDAVRYTNIEGGSFLRFRLQQDLPVQKLHVSFRYRQSQT